MKSDWILVKICMLLSRLVFIREVCSIEMQYVIKVKESNNFSKRDNYILIK